MPFKWNATRIQVLPNQRAGPGGPGSGAPPPSQGLTASTTLNSQIFTNAGPPPQGGLGLLPKPLNVPPPAHPGPQHHQPRGGGGSNDFTGPRDPFGNPRGSSSGSGRPNNSPTRSLTGGGQGSAGKSSDKPDRGASRRGAGSGAPREERRVERSRELSRDKERSRGSPPPARKRSRSPVRTRSRSPRRSTPSRSRSPRSPPRRRARTAPRYNVAVPKISLHFPESNVFDLKHRYSHM